MSDSRTPFNSVTGEIITPFLGQSGAGQALATGGTILSNVGVQRVNPGAAVTGAILAAGTYAGQHLTVMNESANTITFAAAGTSNVVDGVSDVIAAQSARLFVWHDTNKLWYRAG